MKVWIDLSNSPHALLFRPLARRLEEEGHSVDVTVRDNAQTVELARERWPDAVVIGGASPPGRPSKVGALAHRVVGLRRWARSTRPDIALSHNSYAQIVAARVLGLPVVTTMDFEHQPANHLAFRLAHSILVPEALPREVIARQGGGTAKVRTYPGLKEELYLGDFEPDQSMVNELGLGRDGERALVVLRTPPGRAVYHRFHNTLFDDVLRTIGAQTSVRAVALTRFPEQRHLIEDLGLPNCVTPVQAIDSRSLMYAADLVIGAGGTMTREAALLGVPTFSVYAGKTPAVDRELESQGRLSRLRRADQVTTVKKRTREPQSLESLRARSERIMDVFIEELGRLGRTSPPAQAPSP
jgi:uncharacterized protein